MPQKSNTLPVWGNEASMNLNPLILTNIQSSPYFKNELFKLKTYHEVVDEIYFKVDHLEPWERGSRQTSGQIGMCGGVRGVGAGGIVSSAYCLLYKLYTLKLTRKQLNGLLTHIDSPYIRGLGFMFVRYTQPPADLWEWLEPYLEDEEEIDCKAGSGSVMTIGEMVRSFLTKLEWFSTLFPRIPVPIMKDLEVKLQEWKVGFLERQRQQQLKEGTEEDGYQEIEGGRDAERQPRNREKTRSRSRDRHRSRSKDRFRSRSKDRRRSRSRERRSRNEDRHRRSRSRERKRRSRSSERKHRRSQERSRERRRSRSRERRRERDGDDYSRALQRERERQQRERRERRSSSRERRHSRDRDRRSNRDRRRSRSSDRKKSHSVDKERRRSHSPSQGRR